MHTSSPMEFCSRVVYRPASLYRHATARVQNLLEVIPPKSGILCEVKIATKVTKAPTR